MHRRLGFWKRTRWLWPTVILLCAVGCLVAGPLEPLIAWRVGFWINAVPMLSIGAIGCLVGVISEPIQRRDGLALLFSIVVIGAMTFGWLTFGRNEALTRSAWQNHFDRCRPVREEAIAWFRTLPADLGYKTYPESPPRVKALATGGGRVLIRTDKSGRRWLGIAIISYGIDNDKVFLWSESGERPPEEAYPQVVKTWPLGNGWWFASTT